MKIVLLDMQIVLLDGYASNPGDLTWAPLSEIGEAVVYARTQPEEIVERAHDAEIIVTNKVTLTKDILEQLPKLKLICVLATGYNTIDTLAARELGITVCNVPAYSTDSVAQMVFAQILNMTNRVAYYARQSREGKWSAAPDFCYWDQPISELAGKTLGIVGLGHIGSKVASIAREFGMDIFAYTSKNSTDLPDYIQKTTLEGLFGVSDILTLHCPLTPKTYELINSQTLARMKRGALLVNTGRGPLVCEADVAEALASGQLGGYGADVMCSEPPLADNPLFAQPNAFITPHIAWASVEARQRLLNATFENIRRFLAGNPHNVVNP